MEIKSDMSKVKTDKQGYLELEERRGNKAAWKRAYVLIAKESLSFYIPPPVSVVATGIKPTGIIDLRAAYLVNLTDLKDPSYKSKDTLLGLTPFAQEHTTYIFRTESTVDRVNWFNAFISQGSVDVARSTNVPRNRCDTWQPDKDAVRCTQCSTSFSLLRRRHHCRNCGLVFCDKCTSHRRVIRALNVHTPSRLCDACVPVVLAQNARIDVCTEFNSTHSEPVTKQSSVWEKDSVADCCFLCEAAFSPTKRKHYCRRCGLVFCGICTQARVRLNGAGSKPVRLCKECVQKGIENHPEKIEKSTFPRSNKEMDVRVHTTAVPTSIRTKHF